MQIIIWKLGHTIQSVCQDYLEWDVGGGYWIIIVVVAAGVLRS